jgi:hypothetical protein
VSNISLPGKPHILMIEYRSISWWYWLMSVGFLTAGVSGWPPGFLYAIGLTAFQLLHFSISDRGGISFPTQVRLGYLLLLVVALPRSLRLIYWIPTIGTWAQVLFGYCAMARTVSLMPWNRKQGLSVALVKRTFFSAPVRGSILQGLQANPQVAHTGLT